MLCAGELAVVALAAAVVALAATVVALAAAIVALAASVVSLAALVQQQRVRLDVVALVLGSGGLGSDIWCSSFVRLRCLRPSGRGGLLKSSLGLGRFYAPCHCSPVLEKVKGELRQSFSAFGDVFRNTDLRRLEIAWVATQLGRFAYLVAINVYAYTAGGATAVGVVTVIRLVPAAIAAPFTSILGDRYPRKWVMFGANIGQSTAIGAAGVVILADGPSWLVYLLAAISSTVVTAFRPAQAAVVPSLARTPAELTAANVTSTTIESLGLFVGPAVGGVLLAVSSAGTVFIATACAALVSALFVSRITARPTESRARPEEGKLKTAFAGFSTILSNRSLRVLEGLLTAQTFVAGIFLVLVVVAALDLLDMGNGGLGALNAAVGIGGLLGAVFTALLVGLGRVSRQLVAGIFLWGIPIALIGVWPNAGVAIALMLLIGIGDTVVDVTDLTLLQRAVPDEVLARVFGADQHA